MAKGESMVFFGNQGIMVECARSILYFIDISLMMDDIEGIETEKNPKSCSDNILLVLYPGQPSRIQSLKSVNHLSRRAYND